MTGNRGFCGVTECRQHTCQVSASVIVSLAQRMSCEHRLCTRRLDTKGKQNDNNSRLQHRHLIDNFSRRTDQTDTRTKCSHNIRVKGTIVTEDLTDRQYFFGNNTEKGMKAHFKSGQLAGYHRALSKTPGKYFRL